MITVIWMWHKRQRDGDFMRADQIALKGAYAVETGPFKGVAAVDSTTIEGLAKFCKNNGFKLVNLYLHQLEGYIVAEVTPK